MKEYGPEHDRWYAVKDLANAREFIDDYEKS